MMNIDMEAINRSGTKWDQSNHIQRKDCTTSIIKVDQGKINSKTLLFNSEDIIKEISICGWRSKTYLPIIKTVKYSICMLNPPKTPESILNIEVCPIINANKIKYNNENEEKAVKFIQNHSKTTTYELKIELEQIKYTLQDLGKLPFSQIIYLIKELLIGFEVLIDIFDFFDPNQGMVAVNCHNQWKIWIDEDYYLNINKQIKHISVKQFIKKIISMAQNHCMITQQAKYFFSIFQTLQNTNHYNFIKILEKINQFIAINKLFQINKVMIPPNSIKGKTQQGSNKQVKKERFIPQKNAFKEVNTLGNRSYTHLPQNGPYFVPHKKYPTKNNPYNIKKASYYNNISLNPWKIAQHTSNNTRYHHFKTINQQAVYSMNDTDNYDIRQTFKTQKPILNRTSIIAQTKTHFSPIKNQKINSSQSKDKPLLYINKRKSQKNDNKSFFNSQTFQRSKSFKVLKVRKFSHEYQPFENKLNIAKQQKKSNFYPQNRTFHQCKNEQSLNSNSKKSQSKNMISFCQIQNISTPNNSSSTKQIQKQSEFQSTYSKLKINDLGYNNKQKQNYSFVTNFLNNHADEHNSNAKNMSVSHQFSNKKDGQLYKQGEKQMRSGNKIVEGNRMFDLFADNISIRNVDSSVILQKEDQLFEKAHLKDIKLDLLSKFGRNVNHIVEQDDQSFQTRRNNNQLMQLIEEEFDEGKSFFEQNKNQKSRAIQFSEEMPKNSQEDQFCLILEGFVFNKIRQTQKGTNNNLSFEIKQDTLKF